MTRVSRLLASLLLTVCGAALQPAMAQQQTPVPLAAPVNPFLYPRSGIVMGHWDPQQSDVSRLPMPTGHIKPEALDVRFVPGNLINWATAHAPTRDGPEIAWFSGPAMVGTVRLDGGRFELLHTLVVPGYEHLAVKPERMRQLVADLDAAGADEARLRAIFLQGVKEAGLSVATLFNGAYTILDKDGYDFAVYGTGLYKFGHTDPADPLSGLQLVKSLDLKAALPADLAAKVSRVIGINLTPDGRIAFAMSGLVGVVDREFSGLQFITIAGEAIDNNLAADAKGGLYVVTDKFIRKLVWNGKQLSADEAEKSTRPCRKSPATRWTRRRWACSPPSASRRQALRARRADEEDTQRSGGGR